MHPISISVHGWIRAIFLSPTTFQPAGPNFHYYIKFFPGKGGYDFIGNMTVIYAQIEAALDVPNFFIATTFLATKV